MARRINSSSQRPKLHQRGFAYLWTLMLVAFMGVGLTIGADL